MTDVRVPTLNVDGKIDDDFWPDIVTDLPATVELLVAEEVAATAVPNSLVNAKGDLIVATANDTVARLAVGADGYVLSADSAETPGVKWIEAQSGTLDPFLLMGA